MNRTVNNHRRTRMNRRWSSIRTGWILGLALVGSVLSPPAAQASAAAVTGQGAVPAWVVGTSDAPAYGVDCSGQVGHFEHRVAYLGDPTVFAGDPAGGQAGPGVGNVYYAVLHFESTVCLVPPAPVYFTLQTLLPVSTALAISPSTPVVCLGGPFGASTLSAVGNCPQRFSLDPATGGLAINQADGSRWSFTGAQQLEVRIPLVATAPIVRSPLYGRAYVYLSPSPVWMQSVVNVVARLPEVGPSWADAINDTQATVHAQLATRGWAGTALIDVGQGANGSTWDTTVVEQPDVPSAWSTATVTQPLGYGAGGMNLLPGTTYRWRLRFVSRGQTFVGAVHTFTTRPLYANVMAAGFEAAGSPHVTYAGQQLDLADASGTGFTVRYLQRPGLLATRPTGIASGFAGWRGVATLAYTAGGDVHLYPMAAIDNTVYGDQVIARGAAPGNRAFGYSNPVDGLVHVVYRDANAHLHDLTQASPASPFTDTDISVLVGQSFPYATVFSYATTNDSATRIIFVSNGEVMELWRQPWNGWHLADLSGIAGHPPAAQRPALSAWVTPWDSIAHVVYLGTDQHVHELFLPPGGTWILNDITYDTRAPIVVTGCGFCLSSVDPTPDVVGYYSTVDQQQRVVYRGTDGHIHELWDPRNGAWQHGDLTAIAGAPYAADTAPVAFYRAAAQRVQVAYLTTTHHVILLGFSPNRDTWGYTDLTP